MLTSLLFVFKLFDSKKFDKWTQNKPIYEKNVINSIYLSVQFATCHKLVYGLQTGSKGKKGIEEF